MTSSAVLEQKFALAFAAHQAAQWDRATALYREILQSAPTHFDTLHLLGVVYLQTGKYAEALRLLAKAAATNPADATAVTNHANALQALGRHEEAIARYRDALAITPRSVEALKSLADSQQALGLHEQALSAYTAALRIQPERADAYNNQGISLYAVGRHEDALASYDRAVALRPDYAAAYNNRGDALRLLNRLDEALASYDRALSLQPNMVEAHVNRGGTLRMMRRYDAALAAFDDALKHDAKHAKALNNRGALLRDSLRYTEAIQSFNQALALQPRYIEAVVNLASTQREFGLHDQALRNFDKALALEPSHPEAHMNKGLALLATHEWTPGWTEYEWRWKCKDFAFIPRPFHYPAWDGKPLNGGTLLVLGEQGIGDEILYSSMLNDLLAQNVKIVWETEPRLVPLFARSFPMITVVARADPPHPATTSPHVAAQIAIGNLGKFMRRHTENFTGQGYLKVDDERSAGYRRRLRQDGKTRVVGISWVSSNPDFGARKSMALRDLAPLWRAAATDTCFVDLQYGATQGERAAAGLALTRLDDLDLTDDIDGVAALIAACDRVVTISNTTAHLAGGLAVPVDILISEGSGKLWYWGTNAPTTPWYSSARLYRQPAPGAWTHVIEDVARHLTART